VLDPRGYIDVGQASSDGDDTAGEEALVELPEYAVDADGGVTTDAPALVHGQGCTQARLVEVVDGVGSALPDRVWCATEKASVGRLVVVLVQEGPQPDVYVVKRCERAHVVEHGLA